MKKEIVKQFAHLLAGFLIMMHGFQAFEREDTDTAFLFLGIGVTILIIAGIHPWLVRRFRKVNAVFFLLEAAVISFSGWQYSLEGNKNMVIASVIAALFFVWYSIFILLAKSKKHRRRHRSRRITSPEVEE